MSTMFFMTTYGQGTTHSIITDPTFQAVLHGTNYTARTQRVLTEFVATFERNLDVCF